MPKGYNGRVYCWVHEAHRKENDDEKKQSLKPVHRSFTFHRVVYINWPFHILTSGGVKLNKYLKKTSLPEKKNIANIKELQMVGNKICVCNTY